MTKTEKEFKIQKALGLADEYFLMITTTSVDPQIYSQKIKDAVEKHTFVSKDMTKEIKYPYAKYTTTGYGIEYINTGPAEITLIFCVKCIHDIKNLIITELQSSTNEIDIELRASLGLLDMNPITIQQNFTS